MSKKGLAFHKNQLKQLLKYVVKLIIADKTKMTNATFQGGGDAKKQAKASAKHLK